MRKNEKNRAKDNIWLKQAGFFALVLAWILAIYFKNDLSKTMMIIVFILLVIATFFVIFWLNRVFFGLTNQPKEDVRFREFTGQRKMKKRLKNRSLF